MEPWDLISVVLYMEPWDLISAVFYMEPVYGTLVLSGLLYGTKQ